MLETAGFAVDAPDDGGLVVRRDGIELMLHEGAATPAEISQRAPHAASLRRCPRRFVIEFADLDEVLQESNALIEVQCTLQELTEGYLVTPWNRGVLEPHGRTPAPNPWATAMKRAVAPLMKAAGFSRKGSVFTRTHGTASQRVAFRKSGEHQSLDVGWNLEETVGLATNTARVVVGGQAVQFSRNLVPDGVAEWCVPAESDVDDLVHDLEQELGKLLAALDNVQDAASTLAHVDLESGFLRLDRAQLKFVLGDREGALADVDSVCEQFADRRGMTRLEVLRRLGLSDLGA